MMGSSQRQSHPLYSDVLGFLILAAKTGNYFSYVLLAIPVDFTGTPGSNSVRREKQGSGTAQDSTERIRKP